jgi:hypothetical protein
MEINIDIIIYLCSHFLWLWVWFWLDFFLQPCPWDKVSLLYLVLRFKLRICLKKRLKLIINLLLMCIIRAWMCLGCWFDKKIESTHYFRGVWSQIQSDLFRIRWGNNIRLRQWRGRRRKSGEMGNWGNQGSLWHVNFEKLFSIYIFYKQWKQIAFADSQTNFWKWKTNCRQWIFVIKTEKNNNNSFQAKQILRGIENKGERRERYSRGSHLINA